MSDQTTRLSRSLAYYPEQVRKTAPLIHCITNYVTAGDVANLILAAGASPVMTDHPAETASTASACDGLVLNLGTLKIGSVTAMIRAGRAANRKGIPIIFDPVGIGVSAHRRYAARQILSHVSVSIVRGNSSEIRTLANLLGDPVEKEQHGVDAVSVQMPDTHASSDSMNAAKTIVPKSSTASKQSDSSNIPRKFSSAPHSISERLRTDTRIARCLSKKLRAVIVCTGPCDLVVCGSRTARIHNGCPELAQITGSGCMMDGLLAAFAAAISTRIARKEAFPAQQALTAAYLPTAVKNPFKTSAKHPTLYQEKHSSFATSIGLQTPFIYFHSALCAAVEIGLCGEKAAAQMHANGTGLGSFHTYFMDAISQMTGEQLQGGQKIEISTK